MPAKIARSAPRPPFGLPQLTVAVRTPLLSCRKDGKTRIFALGRQPSRGIPDSIINRQGSWTGHPLLHITRPLAHVDANQENNLFKHLMSARLRYDATANKKY
jgi:hypothetical protein